MDAATVSQRADLLYEKMSKSSPSTLFNQDELLVLVDGANLIDVMKLTQDLLNRKLMNLSMVGEDVRFQVISARESEKLLTMSKEEEMIYSHISASGREGIWLRILKGRVNLHDISMNRCLKSLENQRFIKLIRLVKYPTRKIYMLYNYLPSEEVTGGPWYTDSELDTEFIDNIMTVVWRFISQKTYPSAFSEPQPNESPLQCVHPANHAGYATLALITEFISERKISLVELSLNDIRSVCTALIYDDKIEKVKGAIDSYKATWQGVLDSGFGRHYRDKNVLNEEQMAFVANMDAHKQLSIFDFSSVINEDIQLLDILYMDAWLRD